MSRKTLTIAATEFTGLVKSKTFVIGLALMPLLVAVLLAFGQFVGARADTSTRRFAVIDPTGRVYPVLAAAAREMDAERASGRAPAGPRFVPVQVEVGEQPVEVLRVELSDRVRRDDLFAFVEIPPDTLRFRSATAVRYYSSQPSYQQLPLWLETTINQAVRGERFRALNVDQAGMDAALREVPFRQLGLLERDAQGRVRPATEVDRFRSFGTAIGLPILLFMFVMATAPQLLNAVIEEKMSRIAEVMLGSVTASELMWGKLLANVGAAIVLAIVYLGGAALALGYLGYGDMLAPRMLGWFGVFLVLTLLIFGSLFLAIGAACTDLRDAQTMMTPAMMTAVVPYMLVFSVVRSPDTALSAALSLIPFFTPFLMLVRLALEPGPPLWQLLLSFVLTAATASGVVWAAGRILRVGLLVQGKSATFREMLRWARAG